MSEPHPRDAQGALSGARATDETRVGFVFGNRRHNGLSVGPLVHHLFLSFKLHQYTSKLDQSANSKPSFRHHKDKDSCYSSNSLFCAELSVQQVRLAHTERTVD